MTRNLTLPGSLLLLAMLASLTGNADAQSQPVSGTAPDFTLPSNQGNNLRLGEQRGEVILLNFWASWCGPCRQEMPALDALHKRFSPAGFKVLGVNVDADTRKANRILEDLAVAFPVVYDPAGDVSEQYQVNAMPSTVLIDRNGEMRYLHEGYKPGYEDLYRTQISELLGE